MPKGQEVPIKRFLYPVVIYLPNCGQTTLHCPTVSARLDAVRGLHPKQFDLCRAVELIRIPHRARY